MNKGFVMAIDGPVASGKGTLAILLADKLQGFYLYTGAMYRSVALLCLQRNIDIKNPDQAKQVLKDAEFEFRDKKVFLNGRDVTERIKEPDVASAGSVIATYPLIREDLVKKQQEIGQKAIDEGKVVVAEGRDTGTVVFPKAEVKIFLIADVKVRAKRRLEQYIEKGIEMTFDQVLSETIQRDKLDTDRDISPLIPAPDAVQVDTSNDEISDTFEKVMSILKEKGLYD